MRLRPPALSRPCDFIRVSGPPDLRLVSMRLRPPALSRPCDFIRVSGPPDLRLVSMRLRPPALSRPCDFIRVSGPPDLRLVSMRLRPPALSRPCDFIRVSGPPICASRLFPVSSRRASRRGGARSDSEAGTSRSGSRRPPTFGIGRQALAQQRAEASATNGRRVAKPSDRPAPNRARQRARPRPSAGETTSRAPRPFGVRRTNFVRCERGSGSTTT